MPKQTLPTGIYRHYKGDHYKVITVAKHESTHEDLVVYEALYDNPVSRYFVRPYKEFTESIEVNGSKQKRFELIEKIDPSKTQHAAASAFILHDNKALVAQRAEDEPFLPNYWENVGGSIDWGEDPVDGLKREVKEEAGLTVEPAKIYSTHHYMHKDQGRQIIEIAFVCKVIGKANVTLSHEHQAYKWITQDELKDINPMTDKMRKLISEGFKQE